MKPINELIGSRNRQVVGTVGAAGILRAMGSWAGRRYEIIAVNIRGTLESWTSQGASLWVGYRFETHRADWGGWENWSLTPEEVESQPC